MNVLDIRNVFPCYDASYGLDTFVEGEYIKREWVIPQH